MPSLPSISVLKEFSMTAIALDCCCISPDMTAEVMEVHEICSDVFPMSDNMLRLELVVMAPSLIPGNKWRFFDGSNTFSATILDYGFVLQAYRDKRVAEGDTMTVDLRTVQTYNAGQIIIDHSVVKVIEHRINYSKQARLF